ncbi:MAG: MOSC domain-containing protein [Pseudomonadota bacterium]
MPALLKTEFTAKIEYLGYVGDRAVDLASAPTPHFDLTFAGFGSEAHAGETRPSCARVRDIYPRGTPIRNTRQISIVSQEELQQIAQNMGIETLRPEWIGASIMVSGLADFSHLPPSSRLRAPSGATLTIDMENRPCTLPAPVIEQHFPDKGKRFKASAKGLRGVTAWVEREGRISEGDLLELFIPDQPAWDPNK